VSHYICDTRLQYNDNQNIRKSYWLHEENITLITVIYNRFDDKSKSVIASFGHYLPLQH